MDQLEQKKRYGFIAIIITVMFAVIMVIGGLLRNIASLPNEKKPSKSREELSQEMPVEAGVYQVGDGYLLDVAVPTGYKNHRNLAAYYSLRAYFGAPPVIPHEVAGDFAMEKTNCLGCHREGGYVEVFKAFAPVTPHPHFENCRQCHLAQKTKRLFVETSWSSVKPPVAKQVAMVGAPPIIPHPLDLRSNCLSCHGGPGAVAEIRTPHPDRVNCRQCHGLMLTSETFQRPHIQE